jgi:hypothetical protein
MDKCSFSGNIFSYVYVGNGWSLTELKKNMTGIDKKV